MTEVTEADIPNQTLYEILAVEEDVTIEVLKKQYKRLSLRYHPDKNPNGIEKFKEIAAAYKVLVSPESRKVYDEYGLDGLEKQRLAEQNKEINAANYTKFSRILAGAWVGVVVFDYLLGFPFEWLASLVFTVYSFVAVEGVVITWKSLGFILCGDVLAYYLIPSGLLPHVANGLMVLIGLQLLSAIHRSFDLSALVFIFMVVFDIYVRTIPIPWDWTRLLAVHTVAMAAPTSLIISGTVGQEYAPSSDSKLSELRMKFLPRYFYFPLLVLIPWSFFWFVDYYLNISVEWLVAPAFVLIEVAIFFVPTTIPSDPAVNIRYFAGTVAAVFMWYFVSPEWLTIGASLTLNFMLIAITSMLEVDEKAEERFSVHIFHFIVFALVAYVELTYRSYGRYWFPFAASTITHGGIMIWALLTGDKLVPNEEEAEQESVPAGSTPAPPPAPTPAPSSTAEKASPSKEPVST
eukprot:TRINITY_DN3140_c0_g1_i1.p1 TRINITY_DN3140_c0_g1~~TRINITY_DN3140_c0_g1_i1.p1  ORF type:complete len:462 (-),score=82.73 TRINITY_DN3140_c0_g1_i1:238-1623(-)